MKKKYAIIFGIIIILLGMSAVSAGFLDGLFSGESGNNEYKFVDIGTTGNNSSDWHYIKNLKVSVTNKSTGLVNNGDGNAFYSANKPSTPMKTAEDTFDWDAPYTIEFNLISNNGCAIQISDNKNSTSRSFESLGATNNTHVKLINDGTTVKYFINGVNEPVYVYNSTPLNHTAIRFVIPSHSSLAYNNFTIY